MPVSSGIAPWERQTDNGETAKQYAAFKVYRDMGPTLRSIDKVSDVLRAARGQQPVSKRSSNTRLFIWSTENSWVERAKAWDAEQDRIGRAAHIAEIKKMNERQARYGLIAQGVAFKRISQINPDKLTPSEALALLKEAARMERTARGEATEIVKTEGKTEVTISTQEQFKNVPLEKLTLLDEALKDVLDADKPKEETPKSDVPAN